jgi:hypothetical protein
VVKPTTKSLVVVVLGVLALALLAVAPASAQECPVPPNTMRVRFTQIDIGQASGGIYVARIDSVVDCISPSGQDIGDVPATYEVWVAGVNGVSLNGAPPGQHVIVNAPGSFTVSYPASSSLASIQWFVRVGTSGVQAFSGWVNSGSAPIHVGNILARTPELCSLILFGTGAAGGAAYLIARVRGGRHRAGQPND